MCFFKRWICVVLCLSTIAKVEGQSDVVEKLNLQLEKNGISSERQSETISKVIYNKIQYEIYINEPPDRSFNTLTKSYVYLNCEVAETIRDRLMKQIELLPLFYQKDFLFVFNDKFTKRLLSADGVLDDLVEYAEKSINTLMSIVIAHLDNYDTSNNADILKTLLSFCYNINFFISKSGQLDKTALVFILELLYSIQKFMLFNCTVLYYNGKKTMYGLGIKKFDRFDESASTFVSVLRPLNIEKALYCNLKQMIMENEVLRKLGNVEWRTIHGVVSVQTVNRNFFKIFKSLDVIFWYQNYLLNTILKLLFSKTLNQYKKQLPMTGDIVLKLKNFIAPMFEIKIIPSKLMNCLTLMTKRDYSNFSRDSNGSVNTIIEDCTIFLSHVYLEEDVNNLPLSDEGYKNEGIQLGEISNFTLEELIKYFDNFVIEFECFFRLFRFLCNELDDNTLSDTNGMEMVKKFVYELKANVKNTEHHKENTEGKNKITKSVKFSADVKNEDDGKRELYLAGCNCFRGIFHYCSEAMMYLNMAYSKIYDTNITDKYLFRVEYILNEVEKSLKYLSEGYFNFQHYKVVYSVLPVLELIRSTQITKNYDDAKRLISAVMVDLNMYGVRYCVPPDYNFFLFNNFRFDMSSKHSEIDEIINSSIRFLHKNYVYDCKYVSIRHVFKDFDALSIFKKFDDVIHLNWKGQKMNISEIHKTVTRSFTDATTLYSMYDTYMKFSLVAVYIEILKAYREVQTSDDVKEYIIDFNRWDNTLLTRYEKIYNYIVVFMRYHMGAGKSQQDIRDVEDHLSDQFKRIGVSYDVELFIGNFARDTNAQYNISGISYFINSVSHNFLKNCLHKVKIPKVKNGK